MIFTQLFDWGGDLSSWLTSLMPTTGCGVIDGFPTLSIGWVLYYIDETVIIAAFGVMVAFEVAVFGYRLALGIYKLLPFT